MTNEPFNNAKLKIERANRHISEFDAEIAAFSERDPYDLFIKPDNNTETHFWYVTVRERVPEHLSCIIGDAIHNLRSALDLLACDLVALNGGNIDKVYFPFGYSRENFEARISEGPINQAAPNIIDIMRGLKPYKGGNDILRGIHDLDIIDKHRTIITAGLLGILPPYQVTLAHPDGRAITFDIPTYQGLRDTIPMFNEPGVYHPVGTGSKPENLEVNKHIKPPFEIAFDVGQPFEREPVLPTLIQLSELAAEIFRIFESEL